MKQRSGRYEHRRAKEQAREVLWKFLYAIWPHCHPKRVRHFKQQLRKIWAQVNKGDPAINEFITIPKTVPFRSGRWFRRSKAQDRIAEYLRLNQEENQKGRDLCDGFLEILVITAKDKRIAQGQGLPNSYHRKLTEALSFRIEQIGFYPGDRSAFGEGPYRPRKLAPTRAGAELLMRYLNLVYRCGPVHDICTRCGSLMTTAPGRPRKYCTKKCQFGSKEERRKYNREHQRESRANKKKNRKAAMKKPRGTLELH